MNIIDIHIYGFGRFENEHIHFEENGVQVIYGENESGKSTLMAFIEYMLFGFPKRSEKRLRYEPKTTQAYGGKLRIAVPGQGVLTIERKGGASGSVAVIKEDGTKEDELFLKNILAEVNHQTFRDVFSFNLDGLQKVGEIKSDALGEYLFNAGLTGAQQLNQVSDELEDHQTRLFKPNGKNPLLNQKLIKLHDLEQNVKQWSRKLDEYNRMKEDLEIKRNQLSETEDSKKELERQNLDLQHLQSIEPLVERKNTINSQLQELPNATPFPKEGLERFRVMKDKQMDIISDREHLEDLIRKNEEAADVLVIDQAMLARASEISELENGLQLFKGRLEDYHKLKERLTYLQQEIDNERHAIGSRWSEEGIQKVETDLVTKQQLMTRLKRLDSLINDQKRLDEDLEHARNGIEENESKRSKIKGQLLSEETVQTYREKLKKLSHQSPEYLKDQITTLKNIQNPSEGNVIPRTFIWVMIMLGVILAGMWIVNGDYISGLIIGISLIGTGFLLSKKNDSTKGGGLERQISNIEQELKDIEMNRSNDEIDELNETLIDQQHLSAQYKHLLEQADDLEKRYQGIARRYDQWEIEHHRAKEDMIQWRQSCTMPSEVPDEMVLEIFERIDQLKKRLIERDQITHKLNQLQSEINSFLEAVKELSKTGSEVTTQSVEKLLSQLTVQLKDEQKKQVEKERLIRSLEERREQLEGLSRKLEQYTKEQKSLYVKAEVNDEETFIEKGKVNEKYELLMEQLQMVKAQLEASTDSMTLERLENDPKELFNLNTRIDAAKVNLKEIAVQLDQLRDECSQIQANLTHLEEDGTYSHQLHTFHLAKSELIEEAKRWAVYRTAQYALNRAKQNYQAERQPRVIKRAEGHFSFLTENVYERLIAPKGDESFLIERRDKVLFKPEELSRATMEQLYLSLRLALSEEYENHGAFPLIMDDILVNFDQKRKNLASHLIQSIAEHRQILYFTCHQTTAGYLADNPLHLPERLTLIPHTN